MENLHAQGIRLILMRCAGYNNVDLKTAEKYGIKVLRVPGYSPEAVADTEFSELAKVQYFCYY